MAKEKLSASKIAKLTTDGMYGDGGNLWLRVSGNGAHKYWLFRWTERGTGRERVMGLGPLHTINLEEARKLARDHRKVLLESKDPKAERDNARLDAQIAAGQVWTVSQVADEYFEVKYPGKSASRRKHTRLHLSNYVKGPIGEMPIQKVDTQVILEKGGLHALWMQKNSTAGEVQGHLDRMFDFAIRKKYYRGDNPASWDALKDVLPPKRDVHKTKHHKALPYKDAFRFFEALRAYNDKSPRGPDHTMSAYALEFVGLSGVRSGEVLAAQWKEIDRDHMLWNVPPEHTKTRTARPIPITKPMLVVLQGVHERRRDASPDALVFPSSKGNMQIDTWTLHEVIKRMGWTDKKGKPLFTPHGLRSTLRDWMRAETHFNDVLWKIQVGHKTGRDKTDDSYGHDLQLTRRREMMGQWGEYCSKPPPEPKEGKVLKLSDKRRSA
jgi:integrase